MRKIEIVADSTGLVLIHDGKKILVGLTREEITAAEGSFQADGFLVVWPGENNRRQRA